MSSTHEDEVPLVQETATDKPKVGLQSLFDIYKDMGGSHIQHIDEVRQKPSTSTNAGGGASSSGGVGVSGGGISGSGAPVDLEAGSKKRARAMAVLGMVVVLVAGVVRRYPLVSGVTALLIVLVFFFYSALLAFVLFIGSLLSELTFNI